jgi:predicted glycosyltransferase/glutathione synthase/RimK-type ligase-like ATP-grasp enzyme
VVRIGFLLGRSFTDERNMPEVFGLLGQWGATAEPLHLGDDLIDVAQVRLDCDLYVLKSKSDLAMSVAADLHAAGAALLNPYPTTALLRDRIVSFRVLRAAGVPVPETFAASHVSQFLPALDRGPLIVKPSRRFPKQGVAVVTNAAELAALGPMEEPLFAQRYHPSDGLERKIYSIGTEVFGVLRVRPARTYEEKLGRPFTPSPDVVDIARRCGAAFGIDLFSVDIVESGGQTFVVDMSSFPKFTGVPEGPRRLAQYIYAAAERAARGEPVVPGDVPAVHSVAPHRGFKGSALEFVLHALSTTPASAEELDQIQKLLDEIRVRSPGPLPGRHEFPLSGTERGTGGEDSHRLVGVTHTRRHAGCRVSIYSQDSLGLGHLRRNIVIARALLEATADSRVLMFADSPVAPFFEVPERMDHVKLPSMRKVTAGCWEATRLQIDESELIALRANLLCDALLDFRPDLLLVDHMPGGALGELIPALKVFKAFNPHSLIVLGLRDILDAQEVIKRVWEQEGAYEALRRYYDRVLIYGSSEILETDRVYELPPLRHGAHYCGYVVKRGPVAGVDAIRQAVGLGKPRHVFVSAGGGGDGQSLMRSYVQAVRLLGPRVKFGTLMAVGANAPPEILAELEAAARGLPIRVVPFVEHSRSHMAAADLVVCMAGYNTLSEVLYLKKKALVVPRPGPSAEQRMRAELFAKRGLIDVLDPTDLSPETLAQRLVEDLDRTDYPAVADGIPLDGAKQAADRLIEHLRNAAHAAPVSV